MVITSGWRTPIGACAVLAALWSGCGDEPETLPGPGTPDGSVPGTPAGDFTAFDTAIEQFLSERGLSGATAAVIQRGTGVVHTRGYGEFDAGRLFLIASSSKILSAGILLRLADQGLLDIDAPISTYLSGWGEHKTDISVAQLLSNSAGLHGLTDGSMYLPYICQYVDAGALGMCAESIYTAADTADRVPPDTKFRYGGGQWQLAGGIAEVVSGKPWADLVREAYVEPCGAASLGYTNHFARAAMEGGSLGYPAFFMADAANLSATQNPNIEGGAYVTVGDYAKLLAMHLEGGRCGATQVLSEAAVARMQEDRLAGWGGTTGMPGLAGYGLGWWVDRDSGVRVDGGAYGAQPWIDEARGYAAVIFLESDSTVGNELRLAAQPALEAHFTPSP